MTLIAIYLRSAASVKTECDLGNATSMMSCGVAFTFNVICWRGTSCRLFSGDFGSRDQVDLQPVNPSNQPILTLKCGEKTMIVSDTGLRVGQLMDLASCPNSLSQMNHMKTRTKYTVHNHDIHIYICHTARQEAAILLRSLNSVRTVLHVDPGSVNTVLHRRRLLSSHALPTYPPHPHSPSPPELHQDAAFWLSLGHNIYFPVGPGNSQIASAPASAPASSLPPV